MEFKNLQEDRKYELAGYEELEAGESLVLNIDGRPAGLQILSDGDGYKVTDSCLDESTIIAQEDDATDGWNTVNGDVVQTGPIGLQWDGVVTAIRVIAEDGNTGSIKIAWRLQDGRE